MLNYMEEKYQEKFELQESCYGQIGNPYNMIYVKNDRWEHILVRAMIEQQKSCYQDNYQAFLRQKDIEEILKPMIYRIFGECKVFYQIPEVVFPEDIDEEATAEKILQNADCMNMIYIYLPVSTEGTLQKLEQLRMVLNNNEYCIAGVLSCPTEYSWYEMINREMVGKEKYHGYKIKEEWYFRSRNQHGLGYLYVHELSGRQRRNESGAST